MAASILRDINPTDTSPDNLTHVGSLVYFTTENGSSGSDLYRTDGTLGGTSLLRSFAGTASSNASIFQLTAVDATLYFSVSDGGDQELWKSDGSPGGTILVKGFSTGTSGSGYFYNLTAVGSTLFFSASTADGEEIWKSDGTPAGTVQVADLNPGAGSSYPAGLTAVGSYLYFGARSSSESHLYRTDGTAVGTVPISFPDATGGVSVSLYAFYQNIAAVGTSVYFAGTEQGVEGLYRSDSSGTTAVRISDTAPGSAPSFQNPQHLAVIGSTAYFTAQSTDGGLIELWKTDGTQAGTQMLFSANSEAPSAGGSSAMLYGLTPLGGTLLFEYRPAGETGVQLMKSDGTIAGTSLVKDIAPLERGYYSYQHSLVALGGRAYFAASDPNLGVELFATDGTPAGTGPVADLNPGPDGSFPGDLIAAGGSLYFRGHNTSDASLLFRSDGTAAGTTALQSFTPAHTSSSLSWYYKDAVRFNDQVLFAADDGIHGRVLWKTDGTVSGTTLVKDVAVRSNYGASGNLQPMGSYVYFSGQLDDATSGLWRSDGTTVGTTLVKAFQGSGYYGSSLTSLTVFNGMLYFVADDGTSGSELWKSDGTAAGTSLVADIAPGPAGSQISGLTAWGNALYFSANDFSHGDELWRSDGTAAGTMLIKDINTSPSTNGSDPSGFTALGNQLFFTAGDGVAGTELWKTDGTAAGTMLVNDIAAGSRSSSPSQLTVAGGLLFFSADDGVNGEELWKTDGTTTSLVKNINTTPPTSPTGEELGSTPLQLAALGSALIFTADDGATGRELWRSDGTDAGTFRIKDINPGSAGGFDDYSSYYSPLGQYVSGLLHFSADDGTNGVELWQTDGTAAGTFLTADLRAGAGSSTPSVLGVLANGLIVSADDGYHGQEPLLVNGAITPPTNHAPVIAAIATQAVTVGTTATFTVTATDPDAGQSLTYSLGQGAAGDATIGATTGAFHFTPTASGTYNIQVIVKDTGTPQQVSTAWITVVASDIPPVGPTLSSIPAQTTILGNTVTVQVSATNPNSGHGTIYSLGADAPAGATIDPATGVIHFTAASPGSYSFTVAATDSVNGLTSSQSLSVSVQPSLLTVTSVALTAKKGSLTGLTVRVSGPLSATTAPSLSSFSLVQLVVKGKGKNKKTVEKPIALSALKVDAAGGTITLTLKKKFAISGNVQLRIDGAGVADSLGRSVDGDRDGVAGGTAKYAITKKAATPSFSVTHSPVGLSTAAVDTLLDLGMRAAAAKKRR